MEKKYIYAAIAAVIVFLWWKKKQIVSVASVAIKPGDPGYAASKIPPVS